MCYCCRCIKGKDGTNITECTKHINKCTEENGESCITKFTTQQPQESAGIVVSCCEVVRTCENTVYIRFLSLAFVVDDDEVRHSDPQRWLPAIYIISHEKRRRWRPRTLAYARVVI